MLARYSVFSFFFLTPSAITVLVPLSVNNRVPAFLPIAVLLIYALFNARKIRLDQIDFLVLLFIASNFLFAFLSVARFLNHGLAEQFVGYIAAVLSMQFVCLAFILVRHCLHKKDYSIRALFFTFVLGAVLNCLMAFVIYSSISEQLDTVSPYEFRNALYVLERQFSTEDISEFPPAFQILTKYFKVMGGTAAIGPFLSLIGVTVLFVGMFEHSPMLKITFTVVGCLILYVSYQMASRSAVISPILASLFVLYVHFSSRSTSLTRIYLGSSVMCVIFFTPYLLSVAGTSYSDAFAVAELLENPRLELWANAVKLIAVNPFGYGTDFVRFNNSFGVDFPYGIMFDYNHTHNFYIQTFLENGVVGLLVFVLILWILIRTVLYNMDYFRGTNLYAYSIGSFVYLITAIVQLVFGALFLKADGIYAGSFWAIAALVAHMSSLRRKTHV